MTAQRDSGIAVIGVDVAEERKGLDIVGLDRVGDIALQAGGLRVDEVVAEVRRADPTVVGIDAPSGWAHHGSSRVSERALRTLGICAFTTPSAPSDHPFHRWMRVGFTLFEALEDRWPLYRGGAVVGHAAEVYPAATAVLLAHTPRRRDETKVRFRRRVLADNGVDEATLGNIDRVDAALAALTCLRALQVTPRWLGDPAEGTLLLPPAAAPGTAAVTAIHVAPASRLPMQAVDSVEAGGQGLVGDRYHGSRHRHVSVQSIEDLAAAGDELGRDIDPGDTRRNITVSGIEVPTSPGSILRVGAATFEAVRIAAPCRLLDDAIGSGARAALHRRAGTIFRILSPGTIRVGDAVTDGR